MRNLYPVEASRPPAPLGSTRAPLGAGTSREEFEGVLARLGYDLDAEGRERAWMAFAALAERKATVTARDLEALLDDRLRAAVEQFQLLRMAIRSSTDESAWAHVEILERNNEAPAIAEAQGDGPVDAAFTAIREALHLEAELVRFSVDALSGGADALADAHVVVSIEGEAYAGEGIAPDLTEAAVRAYLRALSHERRVTRARA
jgi:2-isopropylmalate synthase